VIIDECETQVYTFAIRYLKAKSVALWSAQPRSRVIVVTLRAHGRAGTIPPWLDTASAPISTANIASAVTGTAAIAAANHTKAVASIEIITFRTNR
jgi:hypothetical protein